MREMVCAADIFCQHDVWLDLSRYISCGGARLPLILTTSATIWLLLLLSRALGTFQVTSTVQPISQSSIWQNFYHKCHCFVGYCHMFTIKHYNTLIYFPDQNFNFSNPSLCNFDLNDIFWSDHTLNITILLKSLFTCLIFSNFVVQNYDFRFGPWFSQR